MIKVIKKEIISSVILELDKDESIALAIILGRMTPCNWANKLLSKYTELVKELKLPTYNGNKYIVDTIVGIDKNDQDPLFK